MAKESLSRYALAPWGMQPNTSHDESLVLYHLSSGSAYYTIFRNLAVTGGVIHAGGGAVFPLPELGEEVHLQRIRQLCRGPEREVDVAREDLGYIRARHLHALRELCLRHPQLLHPEQNAAKERRTNFINRGHCLSPAANTTRPRLILPANNSITIIPPTTPHTPNSLFPTAASTHRLINSPHTSAYKLRPYVATMFSRIRRLGDIFTISKTHKARCR